MFTQFTRSQKPSNGAVVELAKAAATVTAPEPSPQEAELVARLELKSELHDVLLERLNLSVIDKVQPEELRREVATLVSQVLSERGRPMRAEDFKQLIDELLDEVLGFGPLEPLLADPTVNDILVNTHRSVYVERAGVLEKTRVRFRDEKHLLRIIDKIVSRVGRRVDESTPWVDARLEDGSRVNAIIRPCAIDGPSMSIRKFARHPLTMDRLVEVGAMPAAACPMMCRRLPRGMPARAAERMPPTSMSSPISGRDRSESAGSTEAARMRAKIASTKPPNTSPALRTR